MASWRIAIFIGDGTSSCMVAFSIESCQFWGVYGHHQKNQSRSCFHFFLPSFFHSWPLNHQNDGRVFSSWVVTDTYLGHWKNLVFRILSREMIQFDWYISIGMKPPTSPLFCVFVCFSFAVVSLLRIGSDPASSEFWKEKEQKYVRGTQPYFLGGFGLFWCEITLLVGVITSFITGRRSHSYSTIWPWNVLQTIWMKEHTRNKTKKKIMLLQIDVQEGKNDWPVM